MKTTIFYKIKKLITKPIILSSIPILSFIPAQSSAEEQKHKNNDYTARIGSKMVRTYLYTQGRKAGLNRKDITVDAVLLTILRYLISDYKINPSEYHLFFTISSKRYQEYYHKQRMKQGKIDTKDKKILKIIRESLKSSNNKHGLYAFYTLIDKYNASMEISISSYNEQSFIDLFYSSKPYKTLQFKNKHILTSIVGNACKIYLERKNHIIGPCHLPSTNKSSHFNFFAINVPKTTMLHQNTYERAKVLVNTGVVYKWDKSKKEVIDHNEEVRRRSKADLGDLDHGISLIAFSDPKDLQSDKSWAVITFLPEGLKIKQQGKALHRHVILPAEAEKEDLFTKDHFKEYQLYCNKLMLMSVALFSSILKKKNNSFEQMREFIKGKYCF